MAKLKKFGFYGVWCLTALMLTQFVLGVTNSNNSSAPSAATLKKISDVSSKQKQQLATQLTELNQSPLFYPVEVKKKPSKPRPVTKRPVAFTDKLVGVLGETAFFKSGKEVRVGERIGSAKLVSLNGPVAELELEGKTITQSVIDNLGSISSSKSSKSKSSKSKPEPKPEKVEEKKEESAQVPQPRPDFRSMSSEERRAYFMERMRERGIDPSQFQGFRRSRGSSRGGDKSKSDKGKSDNDREGGKR